MMKNIRELKWNGVLMVILAIVSLLIIKDITHSYISAYGFLIAGWVAYSAGCIVEAIKETNDNLDNH